MEIIPKYKVQMARELRQRQTESEALLWALLRGGKVDGLKFRRQRPIGRFVADFCCEEIKLVVEVDGAIHDDPQQREKDVEREAHLTGRGYIVLRVSVNEVLKNFRQVLHQIQQIAQQPRSAAEVVHATGTPLPWERGGGEGQGAGVRASQ